MAKELRHTICMRGRKAAQASSADQSQRKCHDYARGAPTRGAAV